MAEYKKSKYNALRVKWKEHKQEYNDKKILYDGLQKQFVVNVIKFCQDNNLANPFTESSSETQNIGGDANSSSFKSLYRKIVTCTHPDKAEAGEHTCSMYNNANIAKREGNLQELIDVSNKIKIKPDINNFTLSELNLLQSNLDELKNKINNMQNSYPWVWFHSNKEKRNLIIQDFVESHLSE